MASWKLAPRSIESARCRQFVQPQKWLAVQVEARRKTAMAVTFPVAAIPAWFATSWVPHYGVEVPTKDDWAMEPVIVKAQTGQLRFSDLFQLEQEARTVLPKLIFILSAAGGHWNIRELMILSVIICCIMAAGIYWLLFSTGLALGTVALCFWIIALLIFSALDHLELLRPRLISSVELSSLQATADDRMAYGKCEAITPLDAERSRASGFAALNAKGRPADAVILAYETTDRRWIAFALSGEVTIRRDVARQLRNGNQLWSRASPSLSSKCCTSSGSSCAGRDTLQS